MSFEGALKHTAEQSQGKKESGTKLNVPKVFKSLAMAAALYAGSAGGAEAGGSMPLEAATPKVESLKKDLQATKGIERFEIGTDMAGAFISTDKGDVSIRLNPNEGGSDTEQQITGILANVTADQFMREIQRQHSQGEATHEVIQTPDGAFRIDISAYAHEVLKQNGVQYSEGKIVKGDTQVNLAGSEGAPNTECKVVGGKEFSNSVIADCTEVRSGEGGPRFGAVSYQIDVGGPGFIIKQLK